MFKLGFDEIVDVNYIGKTENPIKTNDLLDKANAENVFTASSDTELVLFLGIDMQVDFLEDGALAVPGSNSDLERLLRWLYNNLLKITQFKLSQDTHGLYQIFHAAWWMDSNGEQPAPFTAITLQDLDDRKWIPLINPAGSRDYVANLELLGKKVLVIWPYHCLQGSAGYMIDNQLMNLALFHSRVRRSRLSIMVKGTDPMSEMYGIFKPEYSTKNVIDIESLNAIEKFDKIVISGQAKSHCVLESIAQILEHYQASPAAIAKIFILEDTMSVIPTFESDADATFEQFKSQGVNLVTTETFTLGV